jgi:AcrR family transcriptional regulator
MPQAPAQHTARVDHRTGPRRRGEVLYAAIFDAVLAELDEVGYARLTMERIAARARTSKASLYKRWPSRAELVAAAIRHAAETEPEQLPDTGTIRGDVLLLLRRTAQRLAGPFGEAVRGLLVEHLTDPDHTTQVRATLAGSRDRAMHDILIRAVARREIAASALRPSLIGVAPALLAFHFLTHGAPIPDKALTDIVDDILLPLLASAPPDRRAAQHLNTGSTAAT